jgi:DNA polymerase III sliding clamp (beta) subunit (PCNA family)
MTTTIVIEPNILKAHLITAAKTDLRFYLCGVLVDTTNRRLVSTDGHVLLVTRFDSDAIEGEIVPDFIIGRDQIVNGLKTVAKRLPVTITIDQATVTVGAVTGTVIDGRFPDVARVIPTSISGDTSHFDSELVNRVSDALILVANSSSKTKPVLFQNGTSPAIMTYHGDAFGVVMPMRSDASASDALILVDSIMGRKVTESESIAA